MKKALVALAIAALASTATADITGSKHDLSAGWNALTPRATAALSSCQFCHAPHSANTAAPYDIAPLWNRKATTATYDVKATLSGATPVLAAAGHSLTCLSCHDGVADVGATFSSGDAFTTTGNVIPTAGTLGNPGTNLGSIYNGATYLPPPLGAGHADLRDDHPVGIPYPAVGTTFFVASGTVTATLKLYGATLTVECSSCHDPHLTTNGKFLRVDGAALCATCHSK